MPGRTDVVVVDTQRFLERYPTVRAEVIVDQRTLRPGINDAGDVIVVMDPSHTVDAVYGKTCDHAGGRLQPAGDDCFRCPLHGWVFDPASGHYRHGHPKSSLRFRQESGSLKVDQQQEALRFPAGLIESGREVLELRFIAHACVAIRYAELTLLLDPWLFGPAFSLGWWHRYPPKDDVDEILASADVVFLSHNHSDHMSRETLVRINPAATFLVPGFRSRSALTSLEGCGIRNARSMVFNRVYRMGEKMLLAALDSGDFRDDSGLYLRAGDHELLFAVDSNMLNNWVLPRGIDVLLTSFSSGASGYPWCWEMYDDEKKVEIAEQSKAAAIEQVNRYIQATQPRAYMPYAGFFAPLSADDRYIATNIRHNTPQEVVEQLAPLHPDVRFINPLERDVVTLHSGDVDVACVARPPAYFVDEDYVADYRRQLESAYGEFDVTEVVEYFSRQSFRDELILFIQFADWSFDVLPGGAEIDFRDGRCRLVGDNSTLHERWQASSAGTRKLWMTVRKTPFARVLRERLSWEELSIGFQCRFKREPDVYNVAFWHYFSNEVR